MAMPEDNPKYMADQVYQQIMAQREAICEAFIAATGLQPQEVVQVIQYTPDQFNPEKVTWTLRKKD